ncbi:MAG: SH3 domain-containing protein [Gemmatimonadaceae bacterium]
MLVGMSWGIWTVRGHESLSLPTPTLALATADTVGAIVPAALPTEEPLPSDTTTPVQATPTPEALPTSTSVAPPQERSVGDVRISQAMMTPGSVPWVVATARTWANVRSDADRGSTVVGIITPETRVQLGETRAGWHRLRARGIEGWVDHRLFAMETQGIAR